LTLKMGLSPPALGTDTLPARPEALAATPTAPPAAAATLAARATALTSTAPPAAAAATATLATFASHLIVIASEHELIPFRPASGSPR
jgi:hypothetical protein